MSDKSEYLQYESQEKKPTKKQIKAESKRQDRLWKQASREY